VVDRALAELLADRIAERLMVMLRGSGPTNGRELIDAAEVARILGCERSWVYEHKSELPLVRLGSGSRPRLRFDRARVEAIASAGMAEEVELPAPTPARRPARRQSLRRPAVKQLEIKGRVP
jgi:hypothetical protein